MHVLKTILTVGLKQLWQKNVDALIETGVENEKVKTEENSMKDIGDGKKEDN